MSGGPAAAGLIELLQALPGAHVICEATGGYERGPVAALQAVTLPVTVLNPARVRHFARAAGRLAKTDPMDAAMLSRPASERRPGQRAQACQQPELRRLFRQLAQPLEKQLAKIQALMEKLLDEQIELAARIKKLDAITGVGWITAVTVLARQLPGRSWAK